MNRLGSLVRAARAGARLACQTSMEQQKEELGVVYAAINSVSVTGRTAKAKLSTSSFASSGAVTDLNAEIEHATGLERKQLEAKRKGIDLFHEAWLDAPFGTETNPVEVTSEFSERIVGVPDPDDDSTVWWGVIEEGQPPKQIVEGGEFFVLKRLPSSGDHH
eukprot:jgi/Picsp_1/5533/NSC_02892-R1_cytochrome c oxidase polypeptide iv